MVHAAAALVAQCPCIGFSGSRKPSPASLSAFHWLAGQVPSIALVVVGCAPGIDQAARLAFPSAQVFHASSFGSGRGSFAARSIACVRSVVASGGLWASFPAAPCPGGLLPSAKSSKCFYGSGSGTWASLAFAAGSGLPCLVYLPSGLSAPGGWGLQLLAQGWFQHQPLVVQPTLFI